MTDAFLKAMADYYRTERDRAADCIFDIEKIVTDLSNLHSEGPTPEQQIDKIMDRLIKFYSRAE
jgi:Fic family protein